MKPFSILLLALATVVSPSAHSIDLLDSFELAVENSSDLAAARSTSEAGQLSHDIATAKVYPTISLDASTQYKNKYVGASSSLQKGGVTITQPLWRGSLSSGLKSAEQQEVLAGLQYQKAQLNISLQVVNTYFGVLAAQDQLEITQTHINSIQTVLDNAVVRRDAGVGTETDVRIAEAQLALAKAAVIVAESSLESAKLELAELIGDYPTELQRLNENVPTPRLQPQELQYWIDTALESNADIAIQQIVISIASYAIKLATAESDFVTNLRIRVDDKLSGSDPLANHVTAEVTFSKAFSAGGLATKQRQQATFQHQAELQKLQSIKVRTTTRITSTHRNLTSLMDQIEAFELAVDANKSAFALTETNYEVGLITSLAVIDAQQDLFEAQRDLLKVRYDYIRNLTTLKQIAGTLERRDLEALNRLLL